MKNSRTDSAESQNLKDNTAGNDKLGAAKGWLLQSSPGLAQFLKREMVFHGLVGRNDKIFVRRQRNHDLIFLNRINDESAITQLRIPEAIFRSPIFGRYKVSKRQMQILCDEMKKLGPRRLVVSVAGKHFQRQDFSRWITKDLTDLGYSFDDQVEEEVWLHCVDEDYYFGIPEMKSRHAQSRDFRVAEREGSLPPPIAAAMVFASLPKSTDIVFDPVCGSGTILAEFNAFNSEARLIGRDIDEKAISVARMNLSNVKNLDLKHGDSRHSDLEPETTSVFLANLPFGKQYGEKASNPELYKDLLSEGLRVANRPHWRGVVLTSDLAALDKALKAFPELQSETLTNVKIRGEQAHMVRLRLKK